VISWIEYLVLGVVQGVTEFLPISSDGHLNVVQKLFAAWTGHKRSEEETLFFFVMLHLGTTAAILAHYRRPIAEAIRGLRGNAEVSEGFRKPNVVRVLKLAFVATLPLVPDALFLKKYLEASFEDIRVTALGFLASAAMLAICGRMRGGEKGPRETTFADAIWIGIAQMFAPLPGVSRSGLTISMALARGLSKSWAVGFSLLMAVPAILGAAVFELRKFDRSYVSSTQIAQTLAATVVAGLVGYFAIAWLARIVQKGRLWYFSVYLVVLAAALLIFAPALGDREDAHKPSTLDQPLRTGAVGPGGARSTDRSIRALDRTYRPGARPASRRGDAAA
jgi:undecaprenyl-diphosphatase